MAGATEGSARPARPEALTDARYPRGLVLIGLQLHEEGAQGGFADADGIARMRREGFGLGLAPDLPVVELEDLATAGARADTFYGRGEVLDLRLGRRVGRGFQFVDFVASQTDLLLRCQLRRRRRGVHIGESGCLPVKAREALSVVGNFCAAENGCGGRAGGPCRAQDRQCGEHCAQTQV